MQFQKLLFSTSIVMNLLFIIAKGKKATKKIRIPVVINEDKSQLINITDNAVQKKKIKARNASQTYGAVP